MFDPDKTSINGPLVLSLNDDRSRNPSLVGGKAANLARIWQLPGIQIPPAFIITTEAYHRFINKNPELSRMITDLDDLTDEELIRNHVEKIQQSMRTACIPRYVSQSISSVYRTLRSQLGSDELRVSVRSSATAEDSPMASFAGQYETYLNQRSSPAVLESVRKVWASTFGFNPVNYRNSRQIRHSATEMAVIVQKMVDARSGGTAFTVDLETGIPLIRIHANHGLGEAEVRGSVTPDMWIVDPDSLTIMKRALGEKNQKVAYDFACGKTASLATTPDERTHFALCCAEVRDLARSVRCIGEYYGDNQSASYVDVEFAIDGNDGSIFILQARPETAWGEQTCPLIAVDLDRACNLSRLSAGGFTGSPGVAFGKLCVAGSLEEAERRVRPGDILVVANTTNLWERILGLCSGAITDIGSPGGINQAIGGKTREGCV